jgi:hypothetical protein
LTLDLVIHIGLLSPVVTNLAGFGARVENFESHR